MTVTDWVEVRGGAAAGEFVSPACHPAHGTVSDGSPEFGALVQVFCGYCRLFQGVAPEQRPRVALWFHVGRCIEPRNHAA